MHHMKGNIGTGIFAMGDAMKNAGIILGPIGLFFLGVLNLYCQHQLVSEHIHLFDKQQTKDSEL